MTRNTTHYLFTRLALIISVQLSLMAVCKARDTAARTLSKAKPLYCGFRNHKSLVKNQDIKKIRLSKSVTPRSVKVRKRILNRSNNLSHRASAKHHQISGTFEIPASHRSLQDMQLRVHLYEYEPRKAGGQSTRIGALHIDGVNHTQGQRTRVRLRLTPTAVPHASRAHFLTIEGYQDDQNIYHGRPVHGGIGRVLTGGHPRRVRYIGQRL